jgi:hypothetical protein
MGSGYKNKFKNIPPPSSILVDTRKSNKLIIIMYIKNNLKMNSQFEVNPKTPEFNNFPHNEFEIKNRPFIPKPISLLKNKQNFEHGSASKNTHFRSKSSFTDNSETINLISTQMPNTSQFSKFIDKNISISKSSSPRKKIKDNDKNDDLYFKNGVNIREIDFIYKKIFDKRILNKLNTKVEKRINKWDLRNIQKMKNGSSQNQNKDKDNPPPVNNLMKSNNFINQKIRDMKSKIFFMKGVIDYSYPPIIVKKFQVLNDILEEEKKKGEKIKKEKLSFDYTSQDRIKNENNRKLKNMLSHSLVINNIFPAEIELNNNNKNNSQNLRRNYSCSKLLNNNSSRSNKMLKTSYSSNKILTKNCIKMSNNFFGNTERGNLFTRVITPAPLVIKSLYNIKIY